MLKFYSKGGIMGMNKKQYNNVINWTLKQEQSTQANNPLNLRKQFSIIWALHYQMAHCERYVRC